MRHPSARVLVNRVNIYPYVPAQDADGGNDPAACYPAASFAGLACSAQNTSTEVVEDQGRVSTYQLWTLVFAVDPGVAARDRIEVLTGAGAVAHTLFARGGTDDAGRGMAWSVRAEEKL